MSIHFDIEYSKLGDEIFFAHPFALDSVLGYGCPQMHFAYRTAMNKRTFLRLPSVIQLTGLRKSALYKRIASGTFPSPIKLSARAVAWPSDEIESWQQRQIEARDAT